MTKRDDDDEHQTQRMPAVPEFKETGGPVRRPKEVTQRMVNPTLTEPGRAARESLVVKTEIVLPSDANALGTVFGGRVMEWIDIAGAISAGRHCRKQVVTASMDDLHFQTPIKVGEVVVIQAIVNFAAKTSVEVGVEVFSEERTTGERMRCCHAFLTFVAVDGIGRPVPVPPLIAETTEERRRFHEAEERRQFRLERRDRFR